VLLAACSTVPTTTPTLDQARADFVAANNNPQVASYAPLEFRQASEALDRANQAAAKRESLDTIDRLAYVAKQRIATAQEVAKAKSAEADASPTRPPARPRPAGSAHRRSRPRQARRRRRPAAGRQRPAAGPGRPDAGRRPPSSRPPSWPSARRAWKRSWSNCMRRRPSAAWSSPSATCCSPPTAPS
jgi:hypothetical protein